MEAMILCQDRSSKGLNESKNRRRKTACENRRPRSKKRATGLRALFQKGAKPAGARYRIQTRARQLMCATRAISKLRSAIDKSTNLQNWSTMSNEQPACDEQRSRYNIFGCCGSHKYSEEILSFAVTGPQECFQAIYICRSCNDADGNQPLLAYISAKRVLWRATMITKVSLKEFLDEPYIEICRSINTSLIALGIRL
jgi:hypothetical protein